MFLTLLILSSIFTDIQRSCCFVTAKEICAGMTLKNCLEKHPREVKSCKTCGLINKEGINEEIIGGKAVKPPNLYPWMVSIIHGKNKHCGAAIISSEYLITAAHCLFKNQGSTPFRPDELSVGFLTSTYKLSSGEPIEKLIPHPDYDKKLNKHDIALIKLRKKITCNGNRNPICLPPSNLELSKGIALTITGWGVKQPSSKGSTKTLQMGSVILHDWSRCRKTWHKPIEDHTYCLLGVNDQRPCFGDSGGTMFLSQKKKFISVGVTSFGCNKCSPGVPFVYTAVPKHMSWIRSITKL